MKITIIGTGHVGLVTGARLAELGNDVFCRDPQQLAPDFDAIKAALKRPVVFDWRNLFEPADMAEAGIEHRGIGRAILACA